jgi:hypothetical protein
MRLPPEETECDFNAFSLPYCITSIHSYNSRVLLHIKKLYASPNWKILPLRFISGLSQNRFMLTI